jgi:protein-disulfide isomerase
MNFNRGPLFHFALRCTLVSALFLPGLALSASSDVSPTYRQLQNQIDQLKQDYKALENQLTEIRELFQGKSNPEPAMPANLTLSVDGSPFKGDKDAKLTLVEFSDYECPFCANFFTETLARIEQDFISTGKVKYVRRDFPLVSIHQNAFKAAEAANCAGKQEKYWEMHGRLFAHQNQLAISQLPGHAKAIGLDMNVFEQCFNGSQEAEVRRDVEEGLKAGVQGTPTIFLGVRDGDSQNINVLKMIVGAQPYAQFKEAIEWALQQIQH